MSSFFGGKQRKRAERQAAAAEAEARRQRQTSNEEANREQQRAERGTGGRSGRNRLLGNLGNNLKQVLGG